MGFLVLTDLRSVMGLLFHHALRMALIEDSCRLIFIPAEGPSKSQIDRLSVEFSLGAIQRISSTPKKVSSISLKPYIVSPPSPFMGLLALSLLLNVMQTRAVESYGVSIQQSYQVKAHYSSEVV